jgi:hypothetical protein
VKEHLRTAIWRDIIISLRKRRFNSADGDKEEKNMTVKECYEQMGADYEGVLGRLRSEVLIKKFAKKCKEVHRLIGSMRTLRVKEIISKLNEILTGYFHYYGITDNSERITAFRYNVMKSLFYWLNRRSQKKSYNWVEFLNMLDNSYPLVRPRIYVNIYE